MIKHTKTVDIFISCDGKEFSSEEECNNYEENLNLSPEQKAAVWLHSKHCHYSHTDGDCSWYFEIKDHIHDWSRSTHKFKLEEVRTYEQDCIEFLQILYPNIKIIKE